MCWDLSNTLSAMGIFVSIISIGVALHIYSGWTKQKQKELAANCAEILMEKIGSLRQDILKTQYECTVKGFFIAEDTPEDNPFIANMKIVKEDIEYIQSKLTVLSENINENNENLANENLLYEKYIEALEKLIITLEADPNSIGKRKTTNDIIRLTRNLFDQLINISLYIWK